LRLERFERATPETLGRYHELERSSWKGERGCAIISESHRLHYYNQIAGAADRYGYLALSFLMLDERAIAGVFGLTNRGKFYYLRCAFDPAYSRYSPGQILIHFLLRDCAARHVQEFDFIGEAHDYKMRWTSQTVEHGSCYIFRRGLFGRALHALKFRAVPLGRKLLRRPLPDR